MPKCKICSVKVYKKKHLNHCNIFEVRVIFRWLKITLKWTPMWSTIGSNLLYKFLPDSPTYDLADCCLLQVRYWLFKWQNAFSTFPHTSNVHAWLTNPSQLLIATEASGMSVTSPVKTQSLWMCSLVFSTKSSCHSTKAPGATSLLLALRRRWSSFPNTVTLKKVYWPEGEVTEGIWGAPRATLLLLPSLGGFSVAAALLLPLPAESTWEMYRPWESVLNGTIRPYSFNFPESFSGGTNSVKWEPQSQIYDRQAALGKEKKRIFVKK